MRVSGTPSERELDAIDGFLVPLDQRFDAAVGQILNVAVDAFSCRPGGGEHPESDPLHTPTDQEPPRDDHETMIIPFTSRSPLPPLGNRQRRITAAEQPERTTCTDRLSVLMRAWSVAFAGLD